MNTKELECTNNATKSIKYIISNCPIKVSKPKKERILNKIYIKYIKNILDWTLALIGLIILSPLILAIAIAIKLEDRGPVFFIQNRSGKDGKVFKLYKFRSMVVNNDVHDFKKENKCTKVGKILRKTSLDEIPQLLCILKNQMSFIRAKAMD